MAMNKNSFYDLDSSIVEASDLQEEKEPVLEKEKNRKYVKVVKCDKLRVRAEASADSEVVTVVDKDTKLIFKNKTDADWTRVQTLTGKDGYVMSEYISK